MPNKSVTLTLDILGDISHFNQSLNQMKRGLASLDLGADLQASLELLFKDAEQKLKKFQDLADEDQINLLDQKEFNKTFKQIESLYSQLYKRIHSQGVLSGGFKQDQEAYDQLSNLAKQFSKELDSQEKKEKKLNQTLQERKNILNDHKAEYGEILKNERTYKQLLKGTYAEGAKKQLDNYLAQEEVIRRMGQWQDLLNKKQEEGKYRDKNGNKLQLQDLFSAAGSPFWRSKELKDDLYAKRVLELTQAFHTAEEEQKKFTSADFSKWQSDVDKAQDALNRAKKAYEDLVKQQNEAIVNAIGEINTIDWSRYDIDPTTINSYESLQNAIEKIEATGDELAAKTLKDIQTACDITGKHLENVGTTVDDVNHQFQELTDREKEVEQFSRRLLQFFSIDNAVNLFKRSLREAFNSVKELDAVMTEMAVVTELDVGDYWEQLPKYTKQANELGVATKSVYEAATLYYQQGLKQQQVEQVTTATLKLARIASLDAAEATDRMTNALRGFNMEINETNADRIADVYSKLAAITASNVDEISTAMTKTASIASNAGMEFETTAAFLSQIIETTRESAETAGTALKTVIARFQELKKSPTEIGEVDGEIVDANKVEGALRSVGIALRDSEGQFRKLDEVFIELASKWDSLDKNTQRYIATIAAGSRQQSRFIAMMSNYEHTMELVDAANNAAGASQQQYEKTLESLQSKLDRLKNAWHEFVMGLANNILIKGAIDFLTGLLNTINNLTQGFDGFSKSLLKLITSIILFRTAQLALRSVIGLIIPSVKAEGSVIKAIIGLRKKDTAAIKAHTGALIDDQMAADADAMANYMGLAAKQNPGGEIGSPSLIQKIWKNVQAYWAIYAALAAIAVIIYAIYKNRPETKLKDAEKKLTKLNETLDESTQKVQGIQSGLDGLNQQYNKLNELTKGTQEWNQALSETNSAVLSLISDYPELAQFAKLDSDGIWRIETDSKEVQAVLQEAQKQQEADQRAIFAQQVKVAEAQQKVEEKTLVKSLSFGALSEISKDIVRNYAVDFSNGGYGTGTLNERFTKMAEDALSKADRAATAEERSEYSSLANSFYLAAENVNNFGSKLAQEFDELTGVMNKYGNTIKGINNTIATSLVQSSGVLKDNPNNNLKIDRRNNIINNTANGEWYAALLKANNNDEQKAEEAATPILISLSEQVDNLVSDLENTDNEWLLDLLATGVEGLNEAEIKQLLATTDFNEILSDIFTTLYGDEGKTILQETLDQWKVDATAIQKEANTILRSLGLQNYFTEFTEAVRLALGNKLNAVVDQIGLTSTKAVADRISNILNGLNDKDKEKFLAAFNSLDISNLDAVKNFEDTLARLGIRIPNTQMKEFVNQLKEIAVLTQQVDFTKLKENYEKSQTILEMVQSKAVENNSEFTDDEMQQLIELGVDESSFSELAQDSNSYLYDLDELVKQIYGYMQENGDQLIKGSQERLRVGAIFEELDNSTEYTDYIDENIAKWMQGTQSLLGTTSFYWLQRNGLISQDTQFDENRLEDYKGMIIEAFTEAYGANGATYFDNQLIDQAQQRKVLEYQTARAGSAQDMLNFTDDLEIKERVLSSIVKKTDGLSSVVGGINKQLQQQEGTLDNLDSLTEGHALHLNEEAEAQGQLYDTLKDSTDLLSQDVFDNDLKTLKQLGKIVEDGQKVFGETLTEEFVKDHKQLFIDLTKGGETAQKAYKAINEELKNTSIEKRFGSEAQHVKDLFNELQTVMQSGVVEIDGQSAYQELLSLYGNAEELQKALHFVATITYEGGHQVSGEGYSVYNSAKKRYEYTMDSDTAYIMSQEYGYAVRKGVWEAALGTLNDWTGGDYDDKGSGSDKDKVWENPYDWLYTLTEKIVEKTRERNKLEREYTRLLNKNAETVRQSLTFYNDQIKNLEQQRELQQEMLDKRYNPELRDFLAANQDMTQYAEWVNEAGRGRRIKLNWNAINAVTDPELGARIEKYVSKLEFIQDEMDKAEDALWDIETSVQELKDKAIQAYFSLENRLATALQNIDQNNLDTAKATQDAINNARSELVDSIQKNIDKFRKDRERQKSQKEINDLETRLAYLRQDTSGANRSTIADLEKQLIDLKENFTDTLVDDALASMQEQNEAAAEQRERQLTYTQDLINWQEKTGYYAEKAYDIIERASAPGYIINKDSELIQKLSEGENWKSESWASQMSKFEEAIQQVTDAAVAIQNELVLNNKTDYSAKWSEAYDKYLAAKQSGDKAKEEEAIQEMYKWEQYRDAKIQRDEKLSARYATTGGNATKNAIEGDLSTAYWMKPNTSNNPGTATGGGSTTPETTTTGQQTPPATANEPQALEPGTIASIPDLGRYNAEGVGNKNSDAVKKLQKVLNILYDAGLVPDGSYGPATEAAVKKMQKALTVTQDGKFGPKTRAALQGAYPKYATGGLVPFTGPAWLDGTSAHPEIVLNARDSENLIQLRDILRSESGVTHSGDNYYNIDINVDQLSSDYDVDQVANRIKQIIYNDAMYRNVNAVGIMR